MEQLAGPLWVHPEPVPSTLALLRAGVALRWAAVAGMLVVLLTTMDRADRPELGVVLVLAALAWTAWATGLLARRPGALLSAPVLATELGIGALLQAGEGWVFESGQTWSVPALGLVWPLAGLLSAGVALGAGPGALVGVALALTRLGGLLAPDVVERGSGRLETLLEADVPRLLPTFYFMALFAAVGAGAGYLAGLLRRAEAELSLARAREEVARTLHDGVLQALAVVERRSGDPMLVRLVRDTNADLRRFLFGGNGAAASALPERLGELARRTEADHGLRCRLAVEPELGNLRLEVVDALTGAAGEALANAVRHARAAGVVLYAGRAEGGTGVSVKDDGVGFDPASVPEGEGLTRSVRGRMAEVDGWAWVRSAPGWGTEVRLWAP